MIQERLMSQQSAATSPVSQDSQAPIKVGKMWWFANSQAEADATKADLLAKGVIDVELGKANERGVIDVIFSLDRDRAREILGFEVAEEEWLEAE
jgi:hypothetical protein